MTGRARGEGSAVKPPRRIRHIRIESGALTLDFQGCVEQIGCVADELAAIDGLTVTVDDNLAADLPTLPCAQLWT
ncbi:hypothetical protein ACQP1G_42480 [Nocardia sp. CA-107356]|uniref:hypothetical protein n=1 Tax=Nocardia sp. CA-107356 TaxID=3239972 RepID=UPI003D936D90